MFNPTDHQHRRWNPMKGEWILVSPHRMKRPWSGQMEKPIADDQPEFDPKNPLCPGVTRPNGSVNPDYESIFVFTNDFPALLEDVLLPSEDDEDENSLFRSAEALGTCKVMCFHPKSNKTIALMTKQEMIKVIKGWQDEFASLASKYTWVQIFENKGAMMGCSNPHPHCQIWASSFLPNEAEVKNRRFKEYYVKKGSIMLLDYAKQELERKERIVCQNEDWIVVVPFWAVWPYETMILPKSRHILWLTDVTDQETESLSDIMIQLTTKYDNLFETNFPYSMGFHGAPTGAQTASDGNHWQLHALYFPPLLRSATVKKFMVGYEMLANAQRDLTAEQAAEKLRNVSPVHYKNKVCSKE